MRREVDEISRPGVETGVAVEQVDERDRGNDPGAALPARRDGCLLERCSDREQRVGFACVQVDPVTVLVDDPQRRGHERKVAVP